MALFVDGEVSAIQDLEAYDSSIQALSVAEGVNLNAKLLLASNEIGIELEEFLQKRAGARTGMLTHVVVTPALKQWHTVHALGLIYADINGNHASQRYEDKLTQCRAMAKRAASQLFQVGIGVVDTPIGKASAPLITESTGPLDQAGYLVQVSWTNRFGEAGAPSVLAAVTLETGGGFTVTVTVVPTAVVGFNVYAGRADQQPTKQNAIPVVIGAEWRVPSTGLVEGAQPSTGQDPNWFVRNDRVLQRG